MQTSYADPRMQVMGVPIFTMFAPFPISCFTSALLTDITYYNSANIQWANFSAWALALGEFFLGLLILITFIDIFVASRQHRQLAWFQLALYILVFAVVMVNNFVHARDGWSAVVPQGLALSTISVVIMIIAAFVGTRTLTSEVGGK